ncbi:IS5/IS1182 family transposase, partial [Alkalibaculum sp. M08DMB]
KRASIEGKNAELKRFHGLHRARGYGLLGVSTQSKLAAIAVNIKRIAAKVSSDLTDFLNSISIKFVYLKISV